MSQFFWASKKARMEDPSAVGLGQLAFPLLMENLLRCTVGLVNVTFISHISDSIVSAISVANQYIMVVQVLAMSISMGTITCLNQAIGMHNQHKMKTLSSIAFFSNLLLGFFCELDGSDEIHFDHEELSSAVWIRREDLEPVTENRLSLTGTMIETFRLGREQCAL